jgi:hypothetical protein
MEAFGVCHAACIVIFDEPRQIQSCAGFGVRDKAKPHAGGRDGTASLLGAVVAVTQRRGVWRSPGPPTGGMDDGLPKR